MSTHDTNSKSSKGLYKGKKSFYPFPQSLLPLPRSSCYPDSWVSSRDGPWAALLLSLGQNINLIFNLAFLLLELQHDHCSINTTFRMVNVSLVLKQLLILLCLPYVMLQLTSLCINFFIRLGQKKINKKNSILLSNKLIKLLVMFWLVNYLKK